MAERAYTVSENTTDIVGDAFKKYRIPDDYEWYKPRTPLRTAGYHIVYFIFFVIAWVYAHIKFKIRFVGKEKLREAKKNHHAYFFYGNHTQPFGDIATTILMNWPHRISAVMAVSNMGIPVVGKILQFFNFLPVPKTDDQREKYKQAMTHLVHEDATSFAIYPEAHVWPYYTQIREFSDTSLRYPVRFKVPTFVYTTTYARRADWWNKWIKLPRITVYIDGPFYPENAEAGEAEQKKSLYNQVRAAMERRSKQSTYSYIAYKQVDA